MTENDKKLWEEIENCLEYDDDIYNYDSVFLDTISIENLMSLFKSKEVDILKEFVQFIKDSWTEEIKIWKDCEEQIEISSAFSKKGKAKAIIEQKLISMRKMLGLLDSDFETFLEDKNLIIFLNNDFETFFEERK